MLHGCQLSFRCLAGNSAAAATLLWSHCSIRRPLALGSACLTLNSRNLSVPLPARGHHIGIKCTNSVKGPQMAGQSDRYYPGVTLTPPWEVHITGLSGLLEPQALCFPAPEASLSHRVTKHEPARETQKVSKSRFPFPAGQPSPHGHDPIHFLTADTKPSTTRVTCCVPSCLLAWATAHWDHHPKSPGLF